MPAHVSKAKLVAAFAAIYIIWGSTYLGIKFALESIPPFMIGGTRFLIAGALLFGWSITTSPVRPNGKNWWQGLLLGVFLLGVGNGCVVWAQQRTPSGITALVVAIAAYLLLGLPLANYFWPEVMATRVLGFTLTWFVLGVLFFPFVWIISYVFIRRSMALERAEVEEVSREGAKEAKQ